MWRGSDVDAHHASTYKASQVTEGDGPWAHRRAVWGQVTRMYQPIVGISVEVAEQRFWGHWMPRVSAPCSRVGAPPLLGTPCCQPRGASTFWMALWPIGGTAGSMRFTPSTWLFVRWFWTLFGLCGTMLPTTTSCGTPHAAPTALDWLARLCARPMRQGSVPLERVCPR